MAPISKGEADPASGTSGEKNNDDNENAPARSSGGSGMVGGALSFHKIYDRTKPLMPPPLTVSQLYARALWDPKPTTTELEEKQLAYALGYPMDWRVERTVTYEAVSGEGGSSSSATSRKAVISDRIHAMGGKKRQTLYTWLNHEAAQAAVAELEETGETQLGKTIGTSTSHLLPPKAKYNKGDLVMVHYEDTWWDATVTKRKKVGDEFVYSVLYAEDGATQDEVVEEDIKPGADPSVLAVELGFTDEWKATKKGSRYTITAPDGWSFTSKTAALKYMKKLRGDGSTKKKHKKEEVVDTTEDPPWRTSGHPLIGRKIMWSSEYKASATRRIKIEQEGTIVAYIDAGDKDRVCVHSSFLYV